MPLPVLEKIQGELANYRDLGMGIMEMSHRSKTFEALAWEAQNRVKRLYALSDEYDVLFLHGGATQQFVSIPWNFYREGRPVNIVHSGHWTARAMKEMAAISKFQIIASSEAQKFCELPRVQEADIQDHASYLYYCSNNTIYGTQWSSFVTKPTIPTVIDMSSDVLSKPLDFSKIDMAFAGAQKNCGPSGLCIVIARRSFLESGRDDIPPYFQFKEFSKAGSLYNTPNTFGIYMANYVFEWIEELGGLKKMHERNQEKAQSLYRFLDQSSLFFCPVKQPDRSMMNIVFKLQPPNPEMEKKFLYEAEEAELFGLKGHRIAGGFRASIYNAMSLEGVERLVGFMSDFEKKTLHSR